MLVHHFQRSKTRDAGLLIDKLYSISSEYFCIVQQNSLDDEARNPQNTREDSYPLDR